MTDTHLLKNGKKTKQAYSKNIIADNNSKT